MKWEKKGKELDLYAEQLLQNWNEKVYVLGYGYYGSILVNSLHKNNILSGIVDNDIDKQGKCVCGCKIISVEEYINDINRIGAFGVIATSIRYQQSIESRLKQKGLIHGKDYFYHDEFLYRILPVLITYKYNKSFVPLAQISLTERCTLKCKKCAHACFAVSNDVEDLSLSDVCKSADCFFLKVDYIQEFVLIGGEPLLYSHLAEAIEYIGSKHRSKINIFSITTNGTIVPSKAVLELCKKNNVLYRISNYTSTLPHLKNHYEKLIKSLQQYDISYVLGKQEAEWMDYGFEYVNRTCSEDELIKVFSSCNTPCREVRGNKYYYCVMARSVSENLKFNVGQDDYLDLEKLIGANYKRELLEFNLGYSEKGYLDMCKHCHGSETKNYPIPVAEQVKRNE